MSGCPTLLELENHAAGHNGAVDLHTHMQECARCRASVRDIRLNNALLAELATRLAPKTSKRIAPAPSMPLLESYELLEPIGHGVQGVVYKAVQKATKRVVAIKFLLGGSFASERRRGRFDREVELAAAMRHPNIVTVFDSGATADGRHFCAMEYVEGLPLDAFLGGPQLSVRETLRLFVKVCSAIEYAHQRGVIHRDLKPANILVDASGEPRVVDFGLAKLTGSDAPAMTQTGEFAGTFAYAAPEQTLGRPELLDTRTDVYALGVILYEMLTGELPYDTTGSLANVLRAVAACAPRAPASLRADIDGELHTILMKSLAKEPDRRYQSAGQLAADVEHYLAGEPIDAKRDSAWYVLRKTVRRHRIPFAAAAALVLLVGVVAVAMTIAYRRASRAESATAARSHELARLLSISNIERGRTLAAAGNTAAAEELLWHEYFVEAEDRSVDRSLSPATWALRELYARQPCLRTIALPAADIATAAIGVDGRVVALAERGSDNVQLWDTESGKHISVRSCEGTPSWLMFGPADRWLACGRHDGVVVIWDLTDPAFERVGRKHAARVSHLAFSPDGSELATGDDAGHIVCWALPALEPRSSIATNSGVIRNQIVAQDGALLFSSATDLTARRRAPDSTFVLDSPVVSQRRPITQMALSGDGESLASIGDDIGIWDFRELRRRRTMPGPTGAVTAAALNNDGSLLAVGGADRNIHLWDATSGTLLRVLGGHTGPVNWLRFSTDDKSLVSMSTEDRTMRFWSVGLDASVRTLDPHVDTVQSACYNADGTRLATASGGRAVLLWDVAAAAVKRRLEGEALVHSVAVSCDGLVAAAQNDGSIPVWDSRSGARLATLRGHTGAANSVAFSPDGRALASTSQDGTLRLWEPRSGTCLRTLADSHEPLSRVCFSPDGRLVAAGGKNSAELIAKGDPHRNLVRVWDVGSGRLVTSLAGHRAPVRAVCFSPDGTTLASGSDDQTVRLWNIAAASCFATLEAHGGGVFGLSFRGDGCLLACGGGDGGIRLWDVAQRRCLSTISSNDSTVFGVHLSADGRTLTSWGADKALTIRDLEFYNSCVAGNEPFRRGLVRDVAK